LSAVKASNRRNPLASDCTVLRRPADGSALRFAVLLTPAVLDAANGLILFFGMRKTFRNLAKGVFGWPPAVNVARRLVAMNSGKP
jgi:hypothetical protein